MSVQVNPLLRHHKLSGTLRAAHNSVSEKPLSSILVSLFYQARTYFQNRWTNESAPPPPRSARVSRKKMFSASLICARPIFSSKKEENIFCGTLPSILRAGGGASMRTRFCQTIFLGIWIWQNRDWIFPPAGGVWGGMRAGFPFGFFWRRLWLLWIKYGTIDLI